MGSFALDFPDTTILSKLGDDIDIVQCDGAVDTIKGVFEFKYLEAELADQIDVITPTALCLAADAENIDKSSKVIFNDKKYGVRKKVPADVGYILVILK